MYALTFIEHSAPLMPQVSPAGLADYVPRL